jgi:hypothetical protein
MSEREEETRDKAIDPPENTKNKNMSLDSTEEKANAIDPPENTGESAE